MGFKLYFIHKASLILGVVPPFTIIAIPLHHPLSNPSLSFTLNIKTHNIICGNIKNMRHNTKFFNLILYLREDRRFRVWRRGKLEEVRKMDRKIQFSTSTINPIVVFLGFNVFVWVSVENTNDWIFIETLLYKKGWRND